MPQEHSSEWEITDFSQFVHLYVPDDEMRRMFAETFDRDARLMALPEVTFADAPALARTLRQMTQAIVAGSHLQAEEAMAQTINDFFVDPRYGGMRPCAISGGLAPHVRRRSLGISRPISVRQSACRIWRRSGSSAPFIFSGCSGQVMVCPHMAGWLTGVSSAPNRCYQAWTRSRRSLRPAASAARAT